MTELLHKNDHSGLRKYALMMMWAFPLFFGLLLPWLFSYSWQSWPLLVTFVFAVLYLFAPSFIYYPYRGWMAIARVVGWINTRLILGFTFFVLILPLGLLLRLLGKLQYDGNRTATGTYYVLNEGVFDKERLERPF